MAGGGVGQQSPATADSVQVANVANAVDQDGAAQDQGNLMAGSNDNGMGGFNMPTGNGSFPAMNNGLGGDMTQMQMMMAMQNGIMPGGFNFPMMGMLLSLYLAGPCF